MKYQLRSPLLFLIAVVASAVTGQKAFAAERNPNAVLIFVGDLGYGDLGCYGATKVKTPNIDRLAKEGRRFTDAHSASAVCTPSRYALLTEKYPFRTLGDKGVWGPLPTTSGLIIDTKTLTIGKGFKNKGYATACLGKWHLGFKRGRNDWKVPLRPGPQDVGFDYYFGVPVVNSAPPYVYVENDTIVGYDPTDSLVYGGKPVSPTRTFPKEASVKSPNRFGGALKAHKIYDDEKTGTLLTEKASKWITEKKSKPFFLYFSTTNIHHPFTPAPRFKGTSKCGLYGDFIHELDWMVGRILRCLDDNGLTDNTLVIFTSDNGGMLNLGGRNAMKAGHKINGELLGFKFGVWEGGHRIPFIARWPGKIKAGTKSDQLICQVDLLATFMAVTGQDVQSLKGKDSANLLPALLGKSEKPVRTELLTAPRRPRNLGIRKGKWMYIAARSSGGFRGSRPNQRAWGGPAAVQFAGNVNSDIANGRIKNNAPPAQLYNLEKDLVQTRNVYRDNPQMVKRMEELLNSYVPKKKRGSPRKRRRRKRRPKKKPTAVSPVMAEELPSNKKGSSSQRDQKASNSSESTLGLKPPKNAVVLFDGSNFDAWKPFSFQWINPNDDQKEIQWKLVDGKAMQIAFEFQGKRRKQFLCTKKRFGDYRLHLEFQLPSEGSGNSGIFFGPLYELQILNSTGKKRLGLGDCGAIYKIRVPDVNAALGPGVWQTVDLEYQAARIGKYGFMSEKNAARVSVRLNGKLIHDNFKLSLRRNKYAAFPEEPLSPIVLQEHGSPVKFRNIWVVEKTANKKAQRTK